MFYFIVSATKLYTPKIRFNDDIINANTIGHEIHITRPIVLLLLSMKLINNTDTIVTKNKERFFLYNNIFTNVIGYDDLPRDIDVSTIIDVTQANMWFHGMEHKMEETDLEIRFPILTQIRKYKNIEFRNELFNKLVLDIEYKDCSNIIQKDFIIIHHRIVNYHQPVNYTKNIIAKIKEINPMIDIFIFCIEKLEGYPTDITFINDITTYASLMNHEKCNAVITEFSGGGQLSQYCHNKKIIYFSNTYQFYPNNNDIYKVLEKGNDTTNIYNNFDIKLFTNPSMYVFSNINLLITNLQSCLLETERRILRI